MTTTSDTDGTSSLSTSTEATTGNASSRISRNGSSLDVKTIVSDTEMVVSHLKSRYASEDTIIAATKIASLQSDRVALIQQRDDYLNQRKDASAQVGQLMRQDEATRDMQLLEQQKERSNQAAVGAQKAEQD